MGQLTHIQQELAEHLLLPSHHLVDAGYIRALNVVESRNLHLVGPVDTDHQMALSPRGDTSPIVEIVCLL